mgnify:CR=1 FL=1
MPLTEKVRRTLRRRRSHRAVSGLKSQWSAYPAKWRKHEYLNLGSETLGEEWGGPEFASLIVDELVADYLTPDTDVVELGCGGGKFSQRIAPRVKSLTCCDISPQMIDQTKRELADRGVDENVSFEVLNGIDFTGLESNSADFIFSYDVQLHLQPQNVFSYLVDAVRVLRPGGVFMLHQIKLDSPGGMDHFLSQYYAHTWDFAFDSSERLGHVYFMSEGQMRALATAAGMKTLDVIDDFPGRDSRYYNVTRDRDLFGFFEAGRSRLTGKQRVVKAEGDETVWAVLDGGERVAIRSSQQFERAGFAWDDLQAVSAEELATIPESASPLEHWE